MQIHATVPALRCRLSKARERLRRPVVTRRGVTASALAVAMASTTDASTAVATQDWAEAAVAAATGAASSAAAAAATAQTILRRILITKLKIVAAAAVAATAAIVSAGVVVGTAQPDVTVSPEMTPATSPVIGSDRSSAGTERRHPTRLIEVHGRVIDPDGKPVPGAAQPCARLTSIARSSPRPRQPVGRTVGFSCECRHGAATPRYASATPCSPGSSPRPRGSARVGPPPSASPAPRANS